MLLEENFQIFLSVKNSIRMRTAANSKYAQMKNPRAKRAKLLHFRNVLAIVIVFN